MSSRFSLHSSSEAELRLTVLSLKLSRLINRTQPPTMATAQQVLETIENSQLFEAAVLEVAEGGRDLRHLTFGAISDDLDRIVFAEHRTASGHVRLWLEPTGEEQSAELFSLFADLAAQQLGLHRDRQATEQVNRQLREQVRVEMEGLKLRKAMERAKAILSSRGALNLEQAEEYLVAASVKTGRPLLRVANDVILAFGAPRTSFDWRHGRHDGQTRRWNRAVA